MNTLRIPSVIVVAIAILATPVTIERTFAAANDELQQILESEWEWGLREDPFLAVYIGDSRYADQIPDRSINAYKKRANHTQNILKRLEAIKKDELSPPSILDYDLFYLDVQNRVSAQDFPEELLPINQLDGIHRELNHVARFTPKQSVKHIEYLITRVSQLPTLIDQTIERMQEGLRRGIVPAKMAVANVSSQIASQITANPTESPLFDAMFSDLSSDISKNAEERLKQRAAEVIDKQIYPALRLLQQYWDQEYYPSSRSSIGLSSLPNGLDWYAQKIRFNTSTDMSAEEIHLLGLSEVQRIRGEMTSLMNKLEYDGELADFFHFLRTDPRFYYQTESELLNRYDQIARQTWPNLRRIFGRLPRLPYQISPIPKFHPSPKMVPQVSLLPITSRVPLKLDGLGIFSRTLTTYHPGQNGKWKHCLCTKPCPGITCRYPCNKNSATCQTFVVMHAIPPSSKAGDCMPKALGSPWGFIRISIQSLGSSYMKCGGPSAWLLIPVYMPKAGTNNRQSTFLWIMPVRPNTMSELKSTAISPGLDRR